MAEETGNLIGLIGPADEVGVVADVLNLEGLSTSRLNREQPGFNQDRPPIATYVAVGRLLPREIKQIGEVLATSEARVVVDSLAAMDLSGFEGAEVLPVIFGSDELVQTVTQKPQIRFADRVAEVTV